jgi:sialate O-acetylesterase
MQYWHYTVSMRNGLSRGLRALALALLAAAGAYAEVVLPALLGDHMVLQRRQPVHIWGRAAGGEAVSVSFLAETRSPCET